MLHVSFQSRNSIDLWAISVLTWDETKISNGPAAQKKPVPLTELTIASICQLM